MSNSNDNDVVKEIYTDVTVASGAQTSTEIDLKGGTLVAISMPGTMTSATYDIEANTARGSESDNFLAVSGLTGIAATADSYYPVDPSKAVSLRKFRLNTASNEGGARTIRVWSRAID